MIHEPGGWTVHLPFGIEKLQQRLVVIMRNSNENFNCIAIFTKRSSDEEPITTLGRVLNTIQERILCGKFASKLVHQDLFMLQYLYVIFILFMQKFLRLTINL